MAELEKRELNLAYCRSILGYLVLIEEAVQQSSLEEAQQLAKQAQQTLILQAPYRIHFGTEIIGEPTTYDKQVQNGIGFGCLEPGDEVLYCLPTVYDSEGNTVLRPYVCKKLSVSR